MVTHSIAFVYSPGKEEEADVVFDVDAHEARLGEVVVVDLSLRNNASEPRTFEYRVTASPLLYTGMVDCILEFCWLCIPCEFPKTTFAAYCNSL